MSHFGSPPSTRSCLSGFRGPDHCTAHVLQLSPSTLPGVCTASMIVLNHLDGIRQADPAISNALCLELAQHRLGLHLLVIKGSSTSVPVLAQSDAQRLDSYSTSWYH